MSQDSHHPTAILGFIEGKFMDLDMYSEIKRTA
jgi:hypothetical protein